MLDAITIRNTGGGSLSRGFRGRPDTGEYFAHWCFLVEIVHKNLELYCMIEEGDRVAVRCQLTATNYDGKPCERSIMAIYRFEDGRIAEDWGIACPALWP